MSADDRKPVAERRTVRIAIVEAGNQESTASLAALLTAALSRETDIDLVERSDLSTALREQELAATRLSNEQDRILLGKLLRADGLLLLSEDKRRAAWTVRLVETKRGFQVCQLWFPRKDVDVGKLSQLISTAVVPQTPKCLNAISGRTMVSIIGIRNATLRPENAWTESEIPYLLGAYLSGDERVLVLERQQLGRLLAELESTEGQGTEFARAGVLIDGELVLDEVNSTNDSVSVVFNARLRAPDFSTISTFAKTGTVDNVAGLVKSMASDILSSLPESRQERLSLTSESRLFLKWPHTNVATAYSLDPQNETAAVEMIKELVNTAGVHLDARGRESLSQSIAKFDPALAREGGDDPPILLWRATLLAQAHSMAVRLKSSAAKQEAEFHIRNNSGKEVLVDPHAVENERVRSLLAPIRRWLLDIAERSWNPKYDVETAQYIRDSLVSFDDPSDAYIYIKPTFLDFLGSERRHDLIRRCFELPSHWDAQATREIWCPFFEKIADTSAFSVSICVYESLCKLAANEAQKLGYAHRALDRTEVYLENHIIDSGNMSDIIKGMATMVPRKGTDVLMQMFLAPLEAGDLEVFAELRPHDPGLASKLSSEQRAFIGQKAWSLAQKSEKISWRIENVISCMNRECGPGADINDAGQYAGKVVISSSSLKDYKGYQSAHVQHRLLMVNKTAWVATRIGKGACGLTSFDTETGVAVPYVKFALPRIGMDVPFITDMCQWQNMICIGQRNVGVRLYPIQQDGRSIDAGKMITLDTRTGGLPNTNIRAVEGCGDLLFIALDSGLISWRKSTGRIHVIAGSLREIGDNLGPLDGAPSYEIEGLKANDSQTALYVAVRGSGRTGVWRLDLKSGAWTQLTKGVADLRRMSHFSLGCGGRWIRCLPISVRDGHPVRARLDRFDVNHEKTQTRHVSLRPVKDLLLRGHLCVDAMVDVSTLKTWILIMKRDQWRLIELREPLSVSP